MYYRPLSLPERVALAEKLRNEAAEKLAEAERIEAGVKADQDEMVAAITRAIEAQSSKVPNA